MNYKVHITQITSTYYDPAHLKFLTNSSTTLQLCMKITTINNHFLLHNLKLNITCPHNCREYEQHVTYREDTYMPKQECKLKKQINTYYKIQRIYNSNGPSAGHTRQRRDHF
jgi:hypothetical protein